MGRSLESPETVKEEGIESDEDDEAADRAGDQGSWDQDAPASLAGSFAPPPTHCPARNITITSITIL